MRGFNRAIIAGNLTRDPELRYTVNKKAYARMAVAVNYRYKNASGEYQEGTDYINVVAWGSLGETCGKYLKKGSPVLFEGRISTSSYDAKDGSGKRYSTEIMADNMVMLGSREQGGSSGYQSSVGGDFSSSGGFAPGDGDFGKSIGESGFSQGFTDDDSGIPDGQSETSIPF